MASSIIFLVVIGIWAAFLLPDLQLRRHDLAQSRAANKVLGSARLLKRDDARREDVKPDGVGTVAMQQVTSETKAPPTKAMAITAKPVTAPAASTPPEVEARPAKVRQQRAAKPVTKPATTRRPNPMLTKATALALAGFALLSLIAIPTTAVLAFLKLLPVWSVAIALVAFIAALTGLRMRARRRAAARRRRRTVDSAEAPATKVMPKVERPVAPAKPEVLFDQEAAVVAGPTMPASRQPEPSPHPGAWTPTPVPKPTYLMKPAAPRGMIAPPTVPGVDDAADPYGDLLDTETIDLRDDVVDVRDHVRRAV